MSLPRRLLLLASAGLLLSAAAPAAAAASATSTSLPLWEPYLYSSYDGQRLGYFKALGSYTRTDTSARSRFRIGQRAKWKEVHSLVISVRFRHVTDCHIDQYERQVNRPLHAGPLRGETVYRTSIGHDLDVGDGWIWDRSPESWTTVDVEAGDSRYKCRVVRHRFYITFTRWTAGRARIFEDQVEMIAYGRFG